MLSLIFDRKKGKRFNLLCLGAHSDDIEIGCGGTILRLIEAYPDLSVDWVIFGAHGVRAVEARQSAEAFLAPVGTKRIEIKDFRDGYFPYIGAGIKDYFEQLKKEVSPDLVLTHYRQDLHQDHRLICELTWNTFRSHLIMEYEIPKYDGDLGNPNTYFHLVESICQRKIQLLFEHFKTQLTKPWFTQDTFLALMRLRGVESGAPSKYAEAFYCPKIVF